MLLLFLPFSHLNFFFGRLAACGFAFTPPSLLLTVEAVGLGFVLWCLCHGFPSLFTLFSRIFSSVPLISLALFPQAFLSITPLSFVHPHSPYALFLHCSSFLDVCNSWPAHVTSRTATSSYLRAKIRPQCTQTYLQDFRLALYVFFPCCEFL